MKWFPVCIFLFVFIVVVWVVPWLVTPVCQYPLVRTTTPKIKILTYNTYLLGTKSRKKRLKYFIEHYLDQFDVVCLQEVFYIPYKRHVIREAKKLGFHYFATSPFQYPADSGLLILSKFPLIKTRFVPFHHSCHSDKFSHKGILLTNLWVNDVHIQLVNTHTQAFYNIHDQKAFDVLGFQEIQITNELNPQGPILLCGDLNGIRLEDHTDLRRLTENLLFTGKMKYDKKGWEVDDGHLVVPFELDTILYRNLKIHQHQIEKFECPESSLGYCSDHFGISASISFDE